MKANTATATTATKAKKSEKVSEAAPTGADPRRYPVLGATLRSVDELSADPRNAREHDERSITAIMELLKRFGQRKNIVVDADGVVKAGNGTLEAARRLGWTHIVAGPAPKKKAESNAYALGDNRSAELSSWDQIVLESYASELGEGFEGLGWSPDEISTMAGLPSETPPEAPAEFPTFDVDVKVNCECPKCGYKWSAAKK